MTDKTDKKQIEWPTTPTLLYSNQSNHSSVWLIKVPKHVYDSWDFSTPNKVLATLTHTSTSTTLSTNSQTYSVNLSSNSTDNILLSTPTFSLQIHKHSTLQPSLSSSYSTLLKQRLLSSNIRSSTQVISTTTNSTYLNPKLANVSIKSLHLRKQVAMEKRRERLERGELLEIVFRAFEEFKYWNFKGLVEYTLQPSAWLKEVLGEVCVLNKRGPYVGMYELREEYSSNKSK